MRLKHSHNHLSAKELFYSVHTYLYHFYTCHRICPTFIGVYITVFAGCVYLHVACCYVTLPGLGGYTCINVSTNNFVLTCDHRRVVCAFWR